MMLAPLAWFVAGFATSTATGPNWPDTPAGERGKEFVAAFNSKDRAAIAAFVSKSFVKFSTDSERDSFVERITSISDEAAPLRVEAFPEASKTVIVAKVASPAAKVTGLRVEVEDGEPHAMRSVRFGDVDALMSARFARLDDHWTDYRDLLSKVVEKYEVPAAAIAVVDDNGSREEAVFGTRRKGESDPVQEGDRWLIGSLTKSMTATLIGLLVDNGQLRWDEPLPQALPGMPMRVEYRKATIDELLHHRSGMPQDQTMTGDDVARIAHGLSDPQALLEAYVADALNRPALAQPGAKYAYSNAGYAALGLIASRAMHEPFAEAMRDGVFKPLAMESAIVGTPGAPGQPGSTGQPMGYSVEGGKLTQEITDAELCGMLAPAGLGVSCSVGDLAKFAAFHLAGEKGKVGYLSSKTLRHLHSAGANGTYACGWIVGSDWFHEPVLTHNGSDGTFIAEIAIFPRRKIAVVAIANAGYLAEPTPPMQAIRAVVRRLDRGSNSDRTPSYTSTTGSPQGLSRPVHAGGRGRNPMHE